MASADLLVVVSPIARPSSPAGIALFPTETPVKREKKISGHRIKVSGGRLRIIGLSVWGEEAAERSLQNSHIHMGPHVKSWLVSPENVFRWDAIITGPANCPFENGVFAVSVHIPTSFPRKPPLIKFKTKIFHPNINEKGHTSLDILGSNWSPVLTINKVLLSICSVLTGPVEPFLPDNPAAKLYQKDRKAYEKIAKA